MKAYLFGTVSIMLVLVAGCVTHQQPTVPSAAQVVHCKVASESEISALFDRWNQSLQTGDPLNVVANYAEHSTLLPTVSNEPRWTPVEKEGYFRHFLKNLPSGKIDVRLIEIGCDMAVDSGLYTFTFAETGEVVRGRYSFTYRWDGSKWLIVSHHSSVMPEGQ